jgi:hypothetical protein
LKSFSLRILCKICNRSPPALRLVPSYLTIMLKVTESTDGFVVARSPHFLILPVQSFTCTRSIRQNFLARWLPSISLTELER